MKQATMLGGKVLGASGMNCKHYYAALLLVFSSLNAQISPEPSKNPGLYYFSYKDILEQFADALAKKTPIDQISGSQQKKILLPDKFSEYECLEAILKNFNELSHETSPAQRALDNQKDNPSLIQNFFTTGPTSIARIDHIFAQARCSLQAPTNQDVANVLEEKLENIAPVSTPERRSLQHLVTKTLENAHLVRGPRGNEDKNIVSFFAPYFATGLFAIAKFTHILTNPTTHDAVGKRQNVIRELGQDSKYKHLQSELSKLNNLKHAVPLYSQQSLALEEKIKDLCNEKYIFANYNYCLTAKYYSDLILSIMVELMSIFYVISYVKNGIANMDMDEEAVQRKALKSYNDACLARFDNGNWRTSLSHEEYLKDLKIKTKITVLQEFYNRFSFFAPALGASRIIDVSFDYLIKGKPLFANLHNFVRGHEMLMSIRNKIKEYTNLCEVSRKVSSFFQQYPTIKQNLESTQNIEYLAKDHQSDDEFSYLMKLLEMDTFKGKDSWWFDVGTIMVVCNLLKKPEHHKKFMKAMAELSELDLCAGIAKRMAQKEGPPLCFVEFNDRAGVEFRQVWNFMVDPKQVVANDVTLGGTSPNTIIMTGANTAGKSTFLTSVVGAGWLGSHLGVAPAEKAKIPLSLLPILSTNPKDDIANGVSLFQAEVSNAVEIKNWVKNSDKNCLLVFDELFKGTREKEASVLAQRYLETIKKICPTCTGIFSTHFEGVAGLEKKDPQSFKNYHVEAYKDEQGNIIRTFKLKQGVNTTNLVAAIAAQQLGIDLILWGKD
jgi:DNA mismatch repair ATPase MutS